MTSSCLTEDGVLGGVYIFFVLVASSTKTMSTGCQSPYRTGFVGVGPYLL